MSLWFAVFLVLFAFVVGGIVGYWLGLWKNVRYRFAVLIFILVSSILAVRLPNVDFEAKFPDGRIVPERVLFRLNSDLGRADVAIPLIGCLLIFLLGVRQDTNVGTAQQRSLADLLTNEQITLRKFLDLCEQKAKALLPNKVEQDLLTRLLDGTGHANIAEAEARLHVRFVFCTQLRNVAEVVARLPEQFKGILNELNEQIEKLDP